MFLWWPAWFLPSSLISNDNSLPDSAGELIVLSCKQWRITRHVTDSSVTLTATRALFRYSPIPLSPSRWRCGTFHPVIFLVNSYSQVQWRWVVMRWRFRSSPCWVIRITVFQPRLVDTSHAPLRVWAPFPPPIVTAVPLVPDSTTEQVGFLPDFFTLGSGTCVSGSTEILINI